MKHKKIKSILVLVQLFVFYYCFSLNAISLFSINPHPAVLSSIVRGFNLLGVSYNINPSYQEVHETVVVLDGVVPYLQDMINLKNKSLSENSYKSKIMNGRG